MSKDNKVLKYCLIISIRIQRKRNQASSPLITGVVDSALEHNVSEHSCSMQGILRRRTAFCCEKELNIFRYVRVKETNQQSIAKFFHEKELIRQDC